MSAGLGVNVRNGVPSSLAEERAEAETGLQARTREFSRPSPVPAIRASSRPSPDLRQKPAIWTVSTPVASSSGHRDRRRAPGDAGNGPRDPARPGARARSSTWCSRRRDDRYEARRADGRVTLRAHRRRRLRRGRRSRARTRSPTSRPTSSPASTPSWPTSTPTAADNAYPFAYEQIAQLFDSPAAPDLCVLHSAAHNWEDQGGHLGEHGSLGVVQARAPFVIGGKGVQPLGIVPRVGRLVDVAPTDRRAPRRRAPRRRHATSPSRTASRSPTCSTRRDAARSHVVGVPLRRHQLERALRHRARAARRRTSRGSSRWASRSGTARCRRCRRSRSPTTRRSSPARTRATTASSTTRGSTARRGEQVITNSQATWPWSMQHLIARRRVDPRRRAPHVARRVHRVGQRAVRHRRRLLHVRLLPPRRGAADPRGSVRPAAHRPSDSCARRRTTRGRRSSTTWASSRRSASGAATTATSTYPAPRFMWCNFTLTDAAMHDGGPHSEIAAASVRDSDGRIGEILDARRARRRVRRHRVRARRRPRHGRERPDRHRRLGRRAARRRHPRSATRPTASSTSAS